MNINHHQYDKRRRHLHVRGTKQQEEAASKVTTSSSSSRPWWLRDWRTGTKAFARAWVRCGLHEAERGIYLLAAKWERLARSSKTGQNDSLHFNEYLRDPMAAMPWLACQRTAPRHSAEIRQLQAGDTKTPERLGEAPFLIQNVRRKSLTAGVCEEEVEGTEPVGSATSTAVWISEVRSSESYSSSVLASVQLRYTDGMSSQWALQAFISAAGHAFWASSFSRCRGSFTVSKDGYQAFLRSPDASVGAAVLMETSLISVDVARILMADAERNFASLEDARIVHAVGDEMSTEVWPKERPNCLQPCGKGCFCMAAKHYDDIYFCDCTGRNAENERVYRQEFSYADLTKHPDKKGKVDPAWKHDKCLASAGAPCGALFAELRDVSQVLSEQTGLRPLGAAVFQGHAVWSSDQLMSEVARGSWGLARAHGNDLAVPEGDAEERWSMLWQQRQVVPRTSDVRGSRI
ncbi:unnamed protein product [Symbiodinium natans]|uniref:Uncharacterized protein n=1 Tax=Symbiodinium natans TaxID=878477 RepID=A0A812TM23_9DINO|nr:unnamed protein product [Symbiodinium natans]